MEAQLKNTRIVADIPTPIVRTVPTYEVESDLWTQPSSYIKVTPPVHPLFRDPTSEIIEYDWESEDEEWLSNEITNLHCSPVTASDFELLIDTFEKELAREKILSMKPDVGVYLDIYLK